MNDIINYFKENKSRFILGIGIVCTILCLFFFVNGWKELNQNIKEKDSELLQLDNAIEVKGQSIYIDGDEVYKFLPVSGGTMTINDSTGTKTIIVESFLLGETPVNSRLQAYIVDGSRFGENSSEKYKSFPSKLGERENWEDFIMKLNKLTGHKFRLPSNDEWEYAARGGKSSLKYKYAGGNDIDKVAIYKNNCSGLDKFRFKSKIPNELGFYDMSGGVWELTSTKIEDVFPNIKQMNEVVVRHHEAYPEKVDTLYERAKDYINAHISRGGGYDSPANECELNFRSSSFRHKTGARLVMDY